MPWGAVFGLQQGQSDVQAGLAAMMDELRNMTAAVTGLLQAAVSTTPVTPVALNTWKLSPGPLAIQSGLVTPKGSSKRGAEQSPEQPGAKFLAQAAAAAATAAAAGVACENPCRSVQWMNERGTQNSCEVAPKFSCVDNPVSLRVPKFAGGLALCVELPCPLKEVTLRSLENCLAILVIW